MRLARITADPAALQTGLAGLRALNQKRVPRGAQGWECPLAAADVMVSAHGARANLDAWKITREPSYLEQARYWAQTGIYFHYLWNLPDRPLQRYATIPVFGTSFFTNTWRGVPVQWCGLVYAYALQELAEADAPQSWGTLARGIIHSAMYQQLTSGDAVGTLPDSYGEYFQSARPAYINPENIMTNLHMLHGNSLNIQTRFVEEPSPAAKRISANAAIHSVKQEPSRLRFQLTASPPRPITVLITPTQEPKKVERHNQPVPQTQTLYDQTTGWRYLPKQKALIIRANASKQPCTFTVFE
jgi:hypothetical protein